MSAMFILLFIVIIIATAVCVFLITSIKSKPYLAMRIEMTGYFFLVISLLWGSILSQTTDIVNGQNDINLDEKLNTLWAFEREKTNFDIEDEYTLSQIHDLFNEDWNYFIETGEYAKEQEGFAKTTQYFVATLSTVFIASGRIGEIFIHRSNEIKVSKGIYRNSRKRRGNRK